jgi:aminopeptidase N
MDNVDTEVSFLFSYWYPNVARLPATGDVTVTAPAAWTVIAEGEQQDRTGTVGEARTRWRQTHPVCWLQFAAGPYQRSSRPLGEKTLNIYLLKPDAHAAEMALDTLAQALPFFSRTFSPFPWTHYDVVEYPMTVGALEGYSMTAMSRELLRVALPHELSHSWWGGIVPNTYTVDMWNEGFASYSERLLSEAAKPPAQIGLRAGEKRPRGPRLPPRLPIIGAVDALDEPEATVGYRKGALVLHMFRRTVGDKTFHRVLTRFATQGAGKAATWRDFQATAEEVCGRELGWFFDPWLTRIDAPRVSWGPARQEGGTVEAEIDLANPAYRLRLPVAIDTADGQRRIEAVEVAGPRTRSAGSSKKSAAGSRTNRTARVPRERRKRVRGPATSTASMRR